MQNDVPQRVVFGPPASEQLLGFGSQAGYRAARLTWAAGAPLGWGRECGTPFFGAVNAGTTRLMLLKEQMVMLFTFRRGKREQDDVVFELVTDLPSLSITSCMKIILSTLGPYSRSVYLLIEFFPKLAKINVSSKCHRHYITKSNVFRMVAF